MNSAIVNARARLGDEPLEYLFGLSAAEWAGRSADAHRWKGLSLFGVDGTTIRVPDSEENRAAFGGSAGPRGSSAYPMVRVVALMVLRSHLLRAARFGTYRTSETTLARQLRNDVPDDLSDGRRSRLSLGT